MKTIMQYQCEFCGNKYSREVDARRCEDLHEKPEKVLESRYPLGEKYPKYVTLLMSDGIRVEFIKHDILGR